MAHLNGRLPGVAPGLTGGQAQLEAEPGQTASLDAAPAHSGEEGVFGPEFTAAGPETAIVGRLLGRGGLVTGPDPHGMGLPETAPAIDGLSEINSIENSLLDADMRESAMSPVVSSAAVAASASAVQAAAEQLPGGKGLPPGLSADGREARPPAFLTGAGSIDRASVLNDPAAMHQIAFKAVNTAAMPQPVAVTVAESLQAAQPGLAQAAAGFNPLSKLAQATAGASPKDPASATLASLTAVDAASSTSDVDPVASELLRMNPSSMALDRPTAAQPTAAIPVPRFAGAPGWDQGLGQRILWMVEQGMNQAELRLDPPQLGAVTVRISLSDDQAQLMFQAQHPSAREALESALPKLREMFAEQGLELADADISDNPSPDQDAEAAMGEPAGDQSDGSATEQEGGRGSLQQREGQSQTGADDSRLNSLMASRSMIDEFV